MLNKYPLLFKYWNEKAEPLLGDYIKNRRGKYYY